MGRIAALFAGVAVIAFGGVVGYKYFQGDASGDPFAQCRSTAVAGGTDAIGGPFTLINSAGASVTDADVITEPSILYFGYTFCPDVCPTTLSDISGWLEELGDEASEMNVVFITVDPERDTVEAMAEYVGYFHPVIRGWTGPEDQIARAAEGFRASFERVPTEGGGYTMNHTASVFLFDAEGELVTMIDYHEPREFAVPKIRRALTEDVEGAT